MKLPTSMAGRLLTTVVALVALASILLGALTTIAMRGYLINRLDTQLHQSADRAQLFLQRQEGIGIGGPPGASRFGGPRVGLSPGQSAGTLTALINSAGIRGDVLASDGSQKPLSRDALTELLAIDANGAIHKVSLPSMGNYRVLVRKTDTGTIINGLPTREISGTMANLTWWTTLLALVTTGLAAVAGRMLIRRQLRPLRAIAATAHEVAALPLATGEVGVATRVPSELTDADTEAGQVGLALNQLLDHVENALDARHQSEQQVRQFVADASHELRTPLATIQGYAELMRRTQITDPADYVVAMGKVEAEAGRMSTLVDDLLLLARLDSGRPLNRSAVDLSRLLLEAVDDARVVDPRRRWRLSIPPTPATADGDEQRLHQVVTNLLTNASRHTPPGTVVTVTLMAITAATGAKIRIDVHDDGPGIPADLESRIFERFTRGDLARTRPGGGVGLGLSLVQAIITAHDGTISVDSVPGSTTFSLLLP